MTCTRPCPAVAGPRDLDAGAHLLRQRRSSTNLFITVSVEQGLTSFGTLFISPKGVMEVYDPSGANTPVSDFTALSGVSFPLGS